MKILITGSKGQIGSECVHVLGEKHHVWGLGKEELDITDVTRVTATLNFWQPDIVVNCAAYMDVDACEAAPEAAFQVNAVGPRNLATCLGRQGGLLVHLSTDYVFDGRKPPPQGYGEDDPVAPLSQYGRTKLAGEQAIQQSLCPHIIVRTSWVYSIYGQNFIKKILKAAYRQPTQELKVVHDQYGSLTWAWRVAQQIAELIEVSGRGLYHASAGDHCTWYEVARYLFNRLDLSQPIIPCRGLDYPLAAVRPHNSILENRRLNEAGLNLMRPWQEDLDLFIHRFRNQLLAEAQAGFSC